jgi:aminoglycoside phosphotransferase family enzyme
MESIRQSKTVSRVISTQPSLAEKLQFLSLPAAYPEAPFRVEVIETHMSYVFLAGERVYKLKKPVKTPYLDFSTLEAREQNCREEVRLNRRLASHTYIGVVPLVLDARGQLAFSEEGEVVDWLVCMRRLPRKFMLDHLLRNNGPSQSQTDALCETLAAFYVSANRSPISAKDYGERFLKEHRLNCEVLMRRPFALDHGRARTLLDRLNCRLAANLSLLEQRVSEGHVVDGHGDLRPEHICLCDPVVIFDCLEFNAQLRQVDPFDELAFLGMECAQLGAPWLGAEIIDQMARRLGQKPPRHVTLFYTASRALLRARLTLAHLLDETPREPAKWEPLAARYLDLAEQALAAME